MASSKLIWSFLLIMIIHACLVMGDDDEDESSDKEEPDSIRDNNSVESNNFIVPHVVEDIADRFTRNGKDYYFHEKKVNYYLANLICKNKYTGNLAWVPDLDLANFLAEALSETRLEIDTLWIGGRKKDEESEWEWIQDNKTEKIADNITDNLVAITEVEAKDRNCLGFARQDHDEPQFKALACSVHRSVLCESRVRKPDANGTTHPGWILMDKYEYKIFYTLSVWSEANILCSRVGHNVKLATVYTFSVAENLARYLLIGRPSLENAWVAAKWSNDSYKWVENDEKLPNSMNFSTNYPPWKGEQVAKKNGCVLLDRHLGETTLFVEARCDRQRPFICYRESLKSVDDIKSSDVIIDKYGYRLIYNKMTWEDAFDYCDRYRNYQAKLAEIIEPQITDHLKYIMAENKSTVLHIWLGGRFRTTSKNPEEPIWLWESKDTVISMSENDGMYWIQNTTYRDSVEEINVCLNMDRENHFTVFHYGTNCLEPQSFVCMLPDHELIKLQKEERENEVHTDPPMMYKS